MSPIGDFIIEWKSWKEQPSYDITFKEHEWIGCEYSLDKAKNKVSEYLINKMDELIKSFSEIITPISENMYYDYEMFFKSTKSDFVKIDGWYPIATDRILKPEKIDHYIKTGLLRRVSELRQHDKETMPVQQALIEPLRLHSVSKSVCNCKVCGKETDYDLLDKLCPSCW